MLSAGGQNVNQTLAIGLPALFPELTKNVLVYGARGVLTALVQAYQLDTEDSTAAR